MTDLDQALAEADQEKRYPTEERNTCWVSGNSVLVLAATVRELQKEILRLKTCSTIELMCENQSLDSHVREWEERCLKAEAKLKSLRDDYDAELEARASEHRINNALSDRVARAEAVCRFALEADWREFNSEFRRLIDSWKESKEAK